MESTLALRRGRAAFTRQAWRAAYVELSAADGAAPLAAADLERLAAAAYLVGEDARAAAAWTRAHHLLVEEGRIERAARWGFWLSLYRLLAGEAAQSSGWHARSQRLLKQREEDCAARGYGLIVTGLLALGRGDPEGAGAGFREAVALAERFGERDLLALGLLGHGQSLILAGRSAEGVARLDEAMLAVTAGEVSPVLAGIVYCAVILACQDIFDIRRAREWTRQLDAWCAAQPDLVPYRGQCLVHRSEILQLDGDWPAALAEVAKAREHLAGRSEAVVGRACYQQGELHRLRGDFSQARELFHEAGRQGCEPQPGMALLCLAEGDTAAAAAAIGAAVEAAGLGPARGRLLGPCVEIVIAAGDLPAARAAADELGGIAAAVDAPSLHATAAQASGALLLAEGKAKAALAPLREAWTLWQQLDLPYESARARVLLGQVCGQLGDRETARMHFDIARTVFRKLGAAPDLAGLERLTAARNRCPPGALTAREREVLRLVAAGQTNRQIAAALGLSEHTIARHVSNIFDKLGVASRAAASACALRDRLL